MSIKERLKKYIEYKGMSNRAFSMSIGMSGNYVSSMKNSPQPCVVEKISCCYPDLNTGWLMTGVGKMIKTSIENTDSSDVIKPISDALINELIRLYENKQLAPYELVIEKEQEIERLKSLLDKYGICH